MDLIKNQEFSNYAKYRKDEVPEEELKRDELNES